jgi:hypothetical protein
MEISIYHTISDLISNSFSNNLVWLTSLWRPCWRFEQNNYTCRIWSRLSNPRGKIKTWHLLFAGFIILSLIKWPRLEIHGKQWTPLTAQMTSFLYTVYEVWEPISRAPVTQWQRLLSTHCLIARSSQWPSPSISRNSREWNGMRAGRCHTLEHNQWRKSSRLISRIQSR